MTKMYKLANHSTNNVHVEFDFDANKKGSTQMTIGTLYRMFNNLNYLTHVEVDEIRESDTQPQLQNVVVFSGNFMNMPLKVFNMQFTNFTYLESKNALVINL